MSAGIYQRIFNASATSLNQPAALTKVALVTGTAKDTGNHRWPVVSEPRRSKGVS